LCPSASLAVSSGAKVGQVRRVGGQSALGGQQLLADLPDEAPRRGGGEAWITKAGRPGEGSQRIDGPVPALISLVQFGVRQLSCPE